MGQIRKTVLSSLLLLVATGCGDGDAPPTAKEAQSPPNAAATEISSYGIKVFVERDGAEKLVTVKPADLSYTADPGQIKARTLNPPGQTAKGAPAKLSANADDPEESVGEIRQAATVTRPDGTIENSDDDVVPGWTLLKWAALSCSNKEIDWSSTPYDHVSFDSLGVPWAGAPAAGASSAEKTAYLAKNFYIFHGYDDLFMANCDATLYREEQLLCTADRLAQIGDSAGTVYWNTYEYKPVDGEYQQVPIKITIPPQATKDKFIARDMALNALGHLARLTMRQQSVRLDSSSPATYESRTCGEWYADVANTGNPRFYDSFIIYTQANNSIFTSWNPPQDYFGDDDSGTYGYAYGSEVPVSAVKDLGRRRVDRMSNLLAAGARLTKDLVERSVKDDISGAQKAFASAGDRHGAALRAWGMDPGQEPYNNLRHAMRTLYGRLEMGPHAGTDRVWDPHGITMDDPACFKSSGSAAYSLGTGAVAYDLLPNVSYGIDARWNDIAPSTRGETFALSVIGNAGVVFATPQGVSVDTARSALAEQLVRAAAKRSNKTYAQFTAAPATTAKAVRATVNKDAISDAELKFGFERVYDAFRLLTYADLATGTNAGEYAAALGASALAAGVSYQDATATPEVTAAGGIVLSGPLPRGALAEDLTLRLYGAKVYSNCGVNPSGGSTTTRRSRAMGPFAGDVTAMQNVFLLGDSFRRQMNYLNVLLSDTSELKKSKSFLSLSAAETRQWSGHGVINREYDSSAGVDRYYLIDITPADLGVKDDAELSARLKVVWNGYPAGVQCLAGKRSTALCPDGFELDGANVVQPLTAVTQSTAYAGSETYIRAIEFPHTNSGRSLVLAAKDGKPGRVLGSFRGTSRSGETFAEPLSNWQEELTARAFGLGREATPERTCSATPPLSQPGKYCIEGMDRDQFVPLANELNSNGGPADDAWRHYLDVAEAAALKADELAKQMIETGLSSDIRKEAAAESVAEICGSFPHDSTTATATNGNVGASSDAAIDHCLNPKTVDIVFLAADPLPAANNDATLIQKNNAALCDAYDCDGTSSIKMPWCKKCTPASGQPREEITHAGLGLAERLPFSPGLLDPYESCLDLTNAFYGDQLDYGQFSAIAHRPWVNEGDLMAALQSLTLVENADRSWYLQLNNKTILHAAPGGALTYPDPASAVHKYFYRDANGTPAEAGNDGIAVRLFGQGDAANTHASTREAVELAMFYLGAMAGGIPYGRIWAPVPAVNLTAGAIPPFKVDNLLRNPEDPLFFYSAGRFTKDNGSNLWVFRGDGHDGYIPISLADKAWMPQVYDQASGLGTPAAFFTDRSGKIAGLPGTDWRGEMYKLAAAGAPTDVFLALPTTNSPIKFAANLLGGEVVGPANEALLHDANWTTNTSRAYLGLWLDDLARDYVLNGINGSQSTADKLQQAGWQFTRFRPASSAGQPSIQTYTRALCDRAYAGPVFTKFLGNIVGQAIPGWGMENANRNGNVMNFVLAVKTGSSSVNRIGDPFDMLATAGRQGGPISPGWVAQTNALEFGMSVFQSHWKDAVAGNSWGVAHDRTLPTQCAPSERLEAFLRTEVANSPEAMHTVKRALGLACMASQHANYGAVLSTPPPPVTNMESLRYLENWLALFSHAAKRVAGNLYLVDIPADSLTSVAEGGVGVGAISQGEQGKLLLEIEENLRSIGDGFRDMGSLFQVLAGEIRLARLQIEAAQLEGQSRELGIALQAIENNRQLALSAAHHSKSQFARVMSAVSGLGNAAASYGAADKDPEADGGGNSMKWASAANGADGLIGALEESIIDAQVPTDYEINQDFGQQVNDNLAAQSDLNGQITANGVAQVIANLNIKLPGIYTGINDHLSAIKNTVSNTEQNAITFKQNQQKAAIAVAKATGADFVEVNGQQVPLYVNTVYRRQFDVLRQRYERALESAKRAAYLARLAIEQRIGVRLNDLQSPVGPLEAPKLWVDDVCTVQGVDYDKLRTATPQQDATGAAEVDKIAGFADQYVGDYVAKLREFVEFYNLENPFKESRDTAILSLREMMGDADARCIAPSTNLLFYSDRLDARPSSDGAATAGTTAIGGWAVSGCSDAACADVQAGIALKNGANVLAPPSNPGGTSWLRSVAREADSAVSSSVAPPAVVYQSVELQAGGTYVLSWWDQARTADGLATTANAATVNYPVQVYDSEWRVVSSEIYTPTNAGWSERHELFVQPATDGTYHVTFAAAESGVTGASLAIANVQLEGGQSSAAASAYAQTSASRIGVTSKCKADDPAEFRGRFDYKCDDAQGCYYELRDLLRLDTQLLQQGYSPLTGKVASGNFNYRLGTVALNLVGSSLIDCSQSQLPSCYTTGYIEYDLAHQAQNVPLEDYAGTTRCFDFATGKVNGGKALATERLLTLPLSSTDEGLVNQPSISKQELTGRPLSGTYKLRIRDEPGFIWQHVDDIQLLVNYGYWSRVSKTSG